MTWKSNDQQETALRKLVRQLEQNLCAELNRLDMKQTFVRANFSIEAFEMKRVIFDDSDLVSVDIRSRLGGALQNTTLLFTFTRFNDLLRFSGSCGEKLQLMVSDKLLANEDRPHILDLEPSPLVFTQCHISLSYLIEGDTTCFSVEELRPLSFMQQARNLKNNIRDYKQVQVNPGGKLNQALQEIVSQYRYYQGLKELNLSEQAAREKAGLGNDQLFRLAVCASAVQKKNII